MTSTTETGRYAEDTVANYLIEKKYKIISKNWRTRWCEIDIVAKKKNIIYFVEVKHRKNTKYGDGLDSINNKKLSQMTFSAEIWVNDNNWKGDWALMAASTEGEPPKITAIVDL